MKSQARLRKDVLKEVYQRSRGNLDCPISVLELSEATKLTPDETVVILGQLEQKRLIKYHLRPLTPDIGHWTIEITMHGVEESEHLERPRMQRFATDHPVWWPIVASVVASLVILFLNKAYDALFSRPPVINNIIQLPSKNANGNIDK